MHAHLPDRGGGRLAGRQCRHPSALGRRRKLHAERDELGRRIIPGPDLASFARELHRTERTNNGSSARNRLSGIVTEVILGDVSAPLEIQAGPFRVVAMVSRESAEEMELEPGVPAVAVIKSTNVVVESP